MGVVYSGHDPFTDSEVAVKVALSSTLTDGEFVDDYRKAFFNELHTAGKLKHPNIMKIFDAGTDGEACYIVMELIKSAKTLKSYCTPENLFSREEVIKIIFKCAKALDHAHRSGVVHRDIKPSNILITDDMDIKISDFGIASLMSPDAGNTVIEGLTGTPRYMSPEQVRENEITIQTDLFSLGVVMYEMLTGRHPFPSEDFSRLMHDISNKQPPSLRSHQTDIPEILETIVFRALQKDPRQRYKMGLDIAADLSLAFDCLTALKHNLKSREKFELVKDLEFFNNFPESEIREIIRSCVWQRFETGEEILVEGDIDDAFYIIVSGNVEVYKDKVLIATLAEGDCFGEMGYLMKSKRTATIIAGHEVSLMKIKAAAIEQLSTESQLHFSKTFLRELVKRLSNTTAMYVSRDRPDQ